MINKHENNKRKKHFFITKFLRNNVVIVPILEPCDKGIVTYKTSIVNIYQRVISILNESASGYYNMKMALKGNSHS